MVSRPRRRLAGQRRRPPTPLARRPSARPAATALHPRSHDVSMPHTHRVSGLATKAGAHLQNPVVPRLKDDGGTPQCHAGTSCRSTSLHGDVAKTATSGASTPDGDTLDTDPFGVPRTNGAARYGWLGGKQRSAEALGGVILMGVRLYAPTLGRFLSIDPVPGGSDNAYDYAGQDPLNTYDFDGKRKKKRKKRCGREQGCVYKAKNKRYYAFFIPGLGPYKLARYAYFGYRGARYGYEWKPTNNLRIAWFGIAARAA